MPVLYSVLARCLMPFVLVASLQSWPMLVFFIVANTASFALYAVDKRRAVQQAWRIPEYVLLLTALVAPFGAETGRLVCRHKIRKWYFSATICVAMFGGWFIAAEVFHLMTYLSVPPPHIFGPRLSGVVSAPDAPADTRQAWMAPARHSHSRRHHESGENDEAAAGASDATVPNPFRPD